MKTSNSNSKDNMSISTQELVKELKETEKVLFDLRFKKATRQPFKPHEIKATKKKVAILKTILRSKFLD
jgi:large subunit ribosomal protein L29